MQVYFGPFSNTLEQIKAGKLRALAVTVATRSNKLPEIPTLTEFLPGYEASTFLGVGAPRDTPAEVVDRLNREINDALSDPQFKVRIAEMDGTALIGPSAEFGRLIVDETEKWAEVVKFAGIKLQ